MIMLIPRIGGSVAAGTAGFLLRVALVMTIEDAGAHAAHVALVKSSGTIARDVMTAVLRIACELVVVVKEPPATMTVNKCHLHRYT